MSERIHIQHYRTNSSSGAPEASALYDGELAIRYNEGTEALFIKNSNGDVVDIAGATYSKQIETVSGSVINLSSDLQDLSGQTNTIANTVVAVSGDVVELSGHVIENELVVSTAFNKVKEAVGLSGELEFVSDLGDNVTDAIENVNSSISSHTEDATVHVSSQEKTLWDAKLDASALTNYYTSAKTDELLSAKLDATAYTPTDLSEYWTSAQTEQAIIDATTGIPSSQVIEQLRTDVNAVSGDVNTLSGQVQSKADATALTELSNSLSAYGKTIAYDEPTHNIQLKNGDTVLSQFDASSFIVDGMVSSAYVETVGDDTNLVILFNGDAPQSAITVSLPLGDIFDPTNYYDTGVTNTLLAGKLDVSAITEYWTSAQTNSAIESATSGKADTSAVTAVNDVLTAHTADDTIHVSTEEKDKWNGTSANFESFQGVINQWYGTVEGRLATISGDVKDNANNINSVSGDVEDLQVWSGQTDSRIQDINTSIGTIDDGIENVSGYVVTLDEKVGVNIQNISTISGDVNTLSGQVQSKAETTALTSVNNVLTSHTAESTVHITSAERTAWNEVSGKADVSAVTAVNNALTAHTASTTAHLTQGPQTINGVKTFNSGITIANSGTVRSSAEVGFAWIEDSTGDSIQDYLDDKIDIASIDKTPQKGSQGVVESNGIFDFATDLIETGYTEYSSGAPFEDGIYQGIICTSGFAVNKGEVFVAETVESNNGIFLFTKNGSDYLPIDLPKSDFRVQYMPTSTTTLYVGILMGGNKFNSYRYGTIDGKIDKSSIESAPRKSSSGVVSSDGIFSSVTSLVLKDSTETSAHSDVYGWGTSVKMEYGQLLRVYCSNYDVAIVEPGDFGVDLIYTENSKELLYKYTGETNTQYMTPAIMSSSENATISYELYNTVESITSNYITGTGNTVYDTYRYIDEPFVLFNGWSVSIIEQRHGAALLSGSTPSVATGVVMAAGSGAYDRKVNYTKTDNNMCYYFAGRTLASDAYPDEIRCKISCGNLCKAMTDIYKLINNSN